VEPEPVPRKPPVSAGLARAVLALAGTALGAVLIWVSFQKVDYAAVAQALVNLSGPTAALASLTYFIALAVRILRWRLLINRLAETPFATVSQGLLVGFATNFALPARLGEVFRADVIKEKTALRRSSVLGTIIIERTVDGAILVGLLLASLYGLQLRGSTADSQTLQLMVTAALVFGIALAVIVVLRRLPAAGAGLLRRIFERFQTGLVTLDRHNAWKFIAASAIIACMEVLSFVLMLQALHLSADLIAAALVLSTASLSTLLPTAPAYLGSYQFAFLLAFNVLAWPQADAIAAAFLVQATFFLPVLLVGLALAARIYARVFRRRRMTSSTADLR
jgi:glycosyltransferase 2 family protein